MASSDQFWDAQKMLDLYLHDYLTKKKLHITAAIFRKEANVAPVPVAIDSVDGILNEWWTLFYDTYASRQTKHQEAGQKTENNKLQKTCQILPPFTKIRQRPGQLHDSFNILSRSSAFVLPGSLNHQQHHVRDSITNLNTSYLQQQFRNQDQLLLNRNAINVTGDNPTEVQKSTLLMTRSPGAGINQVPSNAWLSNLHMQTTNQAPQCTMLTDRGNQKKLGPSVSLPPANFRGRSLIPTKSNLGGKDAQQNQRKRRRLSWSRAGIKVLGHPDAEVDKPMDEIESFLSTDDDKDDEERALLGTSTACSKNDNKGISFKEIGCLHSSKGKVLCCQFSSDGRLLASAGHDKKVFIWNMETFDFNDSSSGHSSLITDVRFRPNSTILATSSFDRTLHIWDAAKPSKSLFKLLGHAEHVAALDFHPRKVDLLCSCDSNDEIRLWNVNCGACIKVSKGGAKQVRFQPQYGKLLATASGNSINVLDVENDSRIQFHLKGHIKEVLSICWDISGKHIASVSEDGARVWSLESGGNCIYELHSNGNKFRSCAFHPGHSQLLMVGGYQSIDLWNPIDGNKTQSISAHNGLISALESSPETQMIASASHDCCVKLWK